MYSQKVNPRTTINVPREDVFDFLVQPQQIPLVLPGLIENTDVPELPLKVGDRFTYHYQVSGVMLEGTWTVTELEAYKVGLDVVKLAAKGQLPPGVEPPPTATLDSSKFKNLTPNLGAS